MKAKKTLRKMPPLTRAIAKLQRDAHSLERRFDAIIKLADEIEQEGRTLRRENAELRGQLAVQYIPGGCGAGEALFPELPDGEGIAPPGGCEVDGPGDGQHVL